MDAPTWVEVRVDVPLGWTELIAEALAFGPCTTVALGNHSTGQREPPAGFEVLRTYLPSTEDSPQLRRRLQETLDELYETTRVPELEGLRPEYRPMPAEDYATSWREVWRPFRLGRLVIAQPWWEGELRSGELLLVLEPGGSFGSGRHATTRACLRALLARMRGGERVLDAGSGSGILSVTAALLGAARVTGFDLDPTSSAYGRALAHANGVAQRCTFRLGDFSSLGTEDTGFDVVLANIYSDVVQAEAAGLAARLAPGGWFAFSGCPVHHREATRAAIVACGLTIEEEPRRGRWCTFVGRRGA